VLARHFGVRVSYFDDGRPARVDVSQAAGDALGDCELRADAKRASMFRFRADRVLWSAELDERGRLYFARDREREASARVIQAAYRRFLAAGEPMLTMPPQTCSSP